MRRVQGCSKPRGRRFESYPRCYVEPQVRGPEPGHGSRASVLLTVRVTSFCDQRDFEHAAVLMRSASPASRSPTPAAEINAPVLIVNGDKDPAACGAGSGDCTTSATPQAAERPWFGPDADVAARTVPGLGRVVTRYRNAPTVNAAVITWSTTRPGPAPAHEEAPRVPSLPPPPRRRRSAIP